MTSTYGIAILIILLLTMARSAISNPENVADGSTGLGQKSRVEKRGLTSSQGRHKVEYGISTGGTFQSLSVAQQDRDLTAYRNIGAKWIRVDINWAQIQRFGPSSYDWSWPDQMFNQIIRVHKMKVLAVIVYTPSWNVPSGQSATFGPSPASYAAFASKVAQRYTSWGINTFEIWNEPNIFNWTPRPNVKAYTALLKKAYVAIKRVNPKAKVITAGLSPAGDAGGNISPVRFLQGIYKNGGKRYFDAMAIHPYPFPAMPGSAQGWSPWYQIYGTKPSLRSVMAKNHDSKKKIWATEFGYATYGPPGKYLSEAKQKQGIVKGMKLWSTYSWAGPMIIYQGRDIGHVASDVTNNYGLLNDNGSRKLAYCGFKKVALPKSRTC